MSSPTQWSSQEVQYKPSCGCRGLPLLSCWNYHRPSVRRVGAILQQQQQQQGVYNKFTTALPWNLRGQCAHQGAPECAPLRGPQHSSPEPRQRQHCTVGAFSRQPLLWRQPFGTSVALNDTNLAVFSCAICSSSTSSNKVPIHLLKP